VASPQFTRRSLLSGALLAGAGSCTGGAWAAWQTELAVAVSRRTFTLPGLPSRADGLRVAFLTDLHNGQHTQPETIRDAVRLTSEFRPDLILLGGDYVHWAPSEADSLFPLLAPLDAPLGCWGVLGNHDYADYGNFTDAERTASIDQLIDIHRRMGFELLLNAHRVLESPDGGAVVLAGVENWGRGFRTSGDLVRALAGSGADSRCTILLSHDPTHFEEQVMGNKAPVELTLSGHTHGMQMGIEIPWLGLKVSPSSLRYARWGGLYQEGAQFLHVNRGFGVRRFPRARGDAPGNHGV